MSRLGASWHSRAGQVDGEIADGNKPAACLLFAFITHRSPCVAERILTGAETLTDLAMTHRTPKQRLLRLP